MLASSKWVAKRPVLAARGQVERVEAFLLEQKRQLEEQELMADCFAYRGD